MVLCPECIGTTTVCYTSCTHHDVGLTNNDERQKGHDACHPPLLLNEGSVEEISSTFISYV